MFLRIRHETKLCKRLAWRTRPNEIVSLERKLERVRLMKVIAAVVRLRIYIHASDMEPGALQPLGCASGTTEEINTERFQKSPIYQTESPRK